MPRTPNREHGELLSEGIRLDASALATQTGGFRFDGTRFSLRDAVGEFDPRSAGGGISEAQHEVLDTLVHDLAETAYTEVTRSGGQVSSVIVWTSAAKVLKVRESTLTRSSGQVSVVTEVQYNGAGTAVQTLTHTITRSAGQVASIATVET